MNRDYRLDALSSFVEFEIQGCDRKPDTKGEQIMRPDSLPHPKTCQACAGRHEPHTTCHPKPGEDRSIPVEIDRFLVWGEPELDTNGNRQFLVGYKSDNSVEGKVSVPLNQELSDYLEFHYPCY